MAGRLETARRPSGQASVFSPLATREGRFALVGQGDPCGGGSLAGGCAAAGHVRQVRVWRRRHGPPVGAVGLKAMAAGRYVGHVNDYYDGAVRAIRVDVLR